MHFGIEWRNAEVARSQTGGNLIVWQRADENDAIESTRRLAHSTELRAVADQHCTEIPAPSGMQFAQRGDDVNRAVPAPERTGKHRHGVSGTVERHRAVDSRPKPIRVGAPFQLEN